MSNTNTYNSKVVLGDGTVVIDLTSDTVDASHLLKNYTAHGADGAPITGSCEFDSDTSDDTLLIAEALSGKTFHARGTAYTGTMTNNGAVTGTMSSKSGYVIPQGYHDGSGTVTLDSTSSQNLVAANIRQGVEVLGITGTMSGSEDVHAQTKNVTPTLAQQVITPESPTYNYLTQVTVAAIPITYTDNSAGGVTVTIG